MAKHPSSGMYPFSSPKEVGSKGKIARNVQGTNGRSKPMNSVAAPSKGAKPMAVKIAETHAKSSPVKRGPGVRAGTDAVSKPSRVRPL